VSARPADKVRKTYKKADLPITLTSASLPTQSWFEMFLALELSPFECQSRCLGVASSAWGETGRKLSSKGQSHCIVHSRAG
jgi:hypothetical protein